MRSGKVAVDYKRGGYVLICEACGAVADFGSDNRFINPAYGRGGFACIARAVGIFKDKRTVFGKQIRACAAVICDCNVILVKAYIGGNLICFVCGTVRYCALGRNSVYILNIYLLAYSVFQLVIEKENRSAVFGNNSRVNVCKHARARVEISVILNGSVKMEGNRYVVLCRLGSAVFDFFDFGRGIEDVGYSSRIRAFITDLIAKIERKLSVCREDIAV